MSLNDNNFVITTDIHDWEIVRSADPAEDGQWMRVTGWASDTSRDKRNGIVYPEAIEHMVRIIKDKSPLYRNVEIAKAVQLDVDHSKRFDDQIGYLEDAEVVHNVPAEALAAGVKPPVMQVTAMVDLEMPAGKALKRSLEKGYKLGFSVFGKVLKGYRQVEKSSGQVLEHFLDVALEKIAVTSQPVNPNTWVATIARSMTGVEMEENVVEQEVEKTPMQEILETLDAEAETPANESTEVARSEERIETTAPAAETDADVLAWAQAHAEIVRSLMNVSDEALSRAMEGHDEKEMTDCKNEEMPEVARSEEAEEQPVEGATDVPTLVRSLFATEIEQVKTLLEPLADFVERAERADADLLEANTKLTEELTQIQKDMEVLRGEVEKIGGQSTGLRHVVARSLSDEYREKPVDELPVVFEDVPKAQKLELLRELNQKDPIKATQIVLKMLRDPGPKTDSLTDEARKLVETPA